MARTRSFECWPKGEVARDTLKLGAGGVNELTHRIIHYVGLHKPAWVGRDLYVRETGCARSWIYRADHAKLRRLK
jgi:hypothetical protein